MTKAIVFFEQSNEYFANLRNVMTALTCGNSEEDINIVINWKNHVKIPLFIASALFKSVV